MTSGWPFAKGIGGSDAAAIMGMDPYRSPLDVYLDKTGQLPPAEDNPKMKAGRMMEEVIAQMWADETGGTIRRDNKIRQHPELPYILGNIDRTVVNDFRGLGILECKNTTSLRLNHAQAGGHDCIPAHRIQVLHYMLVTGATWAEIAYLVDGWELVRVPVARDETAIGILLTAEILFWQNHVEKGIPPEAKTVADIVMLFPRSETGKTVEATIEIAMQLNQLREIKQQIAALEKEEESLAEGIKIFMADAEILTGNGEALATWKSAKDALTFDRKKFQAENPGLYAQYCETVPGSRRFLLK